MLVTGDVMLTDLKNGGMMKYTSWPGLGKSPMVENKVKEAIAPESSLPGRPEREELKREGISGQNQYCLKQDSHPLDLQ